MCDLCDRPDLTLDDVLTPIREALEHHRFVVQSITGSRSHHCAEHAPGRLDVPPHP